MNTVGCNYWLRDYKRQRTSLFSSQQKRKLGNEMTGKFVCPLQPVTPEKSRIMLNLMSEENHYIKRFIQGKNGQFQLVLENDFYYIEMFHLFYNLKMA